MKIKLNRTSLILGLSVAISTLPCFPITNQTVAFATSSRIVVLQSDSGNYLGRCNDCVPGGSFPDSAFVHVPESDLDESPWARFAMKKLPNGKYAFQSDSGKYLGRCNQCVPGASNPDSAFVHVLQKDLMKSPFAQFDVKKLSNGNYVLRSDNGKYLSRCNDCVPGASNPDSAFMQSPKGSFAKSPWLQWKITTLP
jgi:hypothetical protein